MAGEFDHEADPSCLAVIPIRTFSDSKTRLSDALTSDERSALMRRLAEGVVGALGDIDLVIVTNDTEVRDWARALELSVVAPAVAGLDAAARCGVACASDRGLERVAIVHADLARPSSLQSTIGRVDTVDVVAVADRHGTGTNVLVVPTSAAFGFAYGPGSFARHCDEAERLGLSLLPVLTSDLGWDVDTEADYELYVGRSAYTD